MFKLIIIILLILLIYYTREPSDERIIYIMPTLDDRTGLDIKGSGLTPLTTPGLKSCIHLKIQDKQETTDLHVDIV